MAVDYRIILYSGITFASWMRIATLTVTVIVLLGIVFVFPMQARFENTVKNTIKNAFLMALSHLPSAFLLIIVYAVPYLILYFVPQLLPAVFLLGFGCIFYFKSFVLLRVFKRYETVPEEAIAEADAEEMTQENTDAETELAAENHAD